jgi:hypothetical protein
MDDVLSFGNRKHKPKVSSCPAVTIRESIDLCNGTFSVKVFCANLRISQSGSSTAAGLGYQHADSFTNWFTRRMDISPQKYSKEGGYPAHVLGPFGRITTGFARDIEFA